MSLAPTSQPGMGRTAPIRRLPLFSECEPEMSVPAFQGIMIWIGLFFAPEVFACGLLTKHGALQEESPRPRNLRQRQVLAWTSRSSGLRLKALVVSPAGVFSQGACKYIYFYMYRRTARVVCIGFTYLEGDSVCVGGAGLVARSRGY